MDIASLAVRIDSTSARTAASDLDGLKKVGAETERAMDELGKGSREAGKGARDAGAGAREAGKGFREAGAGAKEAGREVDRTTRAMDRQTDSARNLTQLIRRYASIAAGAFSVREIMQAADAWQGLQNRLRLVTQGQQQLAIATNDVYQIAQRTSQSIDSVAQVYQRFSQNSDALGLSMEQIAGLSETVGKAIAVSGSSAAAAEGALIQFGQALASGVLRGEEFNSIMEGAPGLMQALATGMGVPLGAMRDLAAQGKITGDVIVDALERSKDAVDAQFDTRVKTIAQSFQELTNSLTRYVGEAASATGASGMISGALSTLAQNVDLVANSLSILAFTALPAAIKGVASFTAVLAANPVGLIAVGISAAIGYMVTFRDEIKLTSDEYSTLSNVVSEVYADIKSGVSTVIDAMSDVVDWFSDLLGRTEESSRDTSKTVVEHLAGAVDSVLGLFNGVGFALMQTLQEAGNAMLAGVETAINALSQALFGFLNWAIDKVNSLSGALKLPQIDQISAPFVALSNDVSGAFDRIQSAFVRGADTTVVQDYLAELAERSRTTAEALMHDVDGMASGLEDLGDSANKPIKPVKDLGGALKATQSERDKYLSGLEKEIDRINDQARSLEFQNDTYGMTEDAILGVTIARLEEQNAILATIEGAEEEVAIRERLIGAYKRMQEATSQNQALQEAERANKKMLDDWQRSVDEYDKIFREGFAAMLFEGGNSFSSWTESLWVTFKTAIADQIYKMFAQPIVVNLVGSLTGFLGGGAGQAAAGMASGAGGGLMDLLSGGSTLYNVLSGGFAGIGASVSTAVSNMGASMFMGSSGGLSSSVGASLMNSASALGSAATALSGVAAGFGLGTMISGNLSVGGSSMAAPGVGALGGAGIGFALGGPVGAAIGGLLGGTGGGLINRMFGSGPKEVQSEGWRGTIGASGADLQSYSSWKKSGGWFSGGSSGTDIRPMDPAVQSFFDGSAQAISASVAAMAESIGESADNINSFALSIDLTTRGLSEEEIQQKIQDTFVGFEAGVTRHLIPGISAYMKEGERAGDTLRRLSGSLTTVNGIFDVMGLRLYDVSVDGAAAASTLVDLTGGMEAFTQATDAYYQNFYGQAERLGHITDQFTSAVTALGLEVPRTRQQFRELVEAANALQHQELLASLLNLAPVMAEIAKSTDEIVNQRKGLVERLLQLTGQTAELRARELEALDPSSRVLQQRIWALEDEAAAIEQVTRIQQQFTQSQVSAIQSSEQLIANLRNSLGDYLAQLRGTSAGLGSPSSQLQSAQQDYNLQLARAKGGDQDAIAGITQYADRLIQAGKGMFASGSGSQNIIEQVMRDLESLPDQIKVEELILDQLGELQREILLSSTDLQAAIRDGSPSKISAALSPLFDMLDANLDGKLTLQEMQYALKGIATDAQIRAAFAVLDTNYDNVITRLETTISNGLIEFDQNLTEAIEANSPSLISEALRPYFASLDTNLDGKLTFSEIKTALNGKATDAQIRSLFAKYDANNDSALTRTELGVTGAVLSASQALQQALLTGSPDSIARALAPHFTLIDDNLDGKLTFAEMQAALKGIATDSQIRSVIAASDKNLDGYLSRAEIGLTKAVLEGSLDLARAIATDSPEAIRIALAPYFNLIDDNLDGKLTLAEMRTALDGIATDDQIDAVFARFDENNDKALTRTELGVTAAILGASDAVKQAIAANSPSLLSAALAPHFALIDENLDGKLTFSEMQTALKGVATDKQISAVFSLLDKNQDLALTRTEMGIAQAVMAADSRLRAAILDGSPDLIAQSLSPYFELLDENLDGKITFDEMSRALVGIATDDQIRQVMGRLDANQDDALTRTEMGITRALLSSSEQLRQALDANSPDLISAALAPHFQAIDANLDGKLTFDEVSDALEGIATDNQIKTFFGASDKNQDKFLSRTELGITRAALQSSSAIRQAVSENSPDKLAKALGPHFNLIDENLDGKLTFEEMQTALKGIATDDQIKSVFEHSDQNQDGALTRTEIGITGAILSASDALQRAILDGSPDLISAALAPHFSLLDENLDGKITFDEMTRALKGIATDSQIKAVFATSDKNQNQSLSMTEMGITGSVLSASDTLRRAILDGSPALIASALSPNFMMIDENLDGLLTQDEVEAALKGIATDEQIKKFFAASDTNADKTLSRTEVGITKSVIGSSKSVVDAINSGSPELMASALSPYFSLLDENLDGKLTFAEMSRALAGIATDKQIGSVFSKYDTNQNKSLSRTELGITKSVLSSSAALQKALASNSPKLIADSLSPYFGLIDENLDGKLTLDEMQSALKGIATDSQIKAVFAASDKNDDKILSRTEMGITKSVLSSSTTLQKALASNSPDLISKALAPHFGLIDENMDGIISFEEMKAALNGIATDKQIKTVFDSMDKNLDGSISQAEGEIVGAVWKIPAGIKGSLSPYFNDISRGVGGIATGVNRLLSPYFKGLDTDSGKIREHTYNSFVQLSGLAKGIEGRLDPYFTWIGEEIETLPGGINDELENQFDGMLNGIIDLPDGIGEVLKPHFLLVASGLATLGKGMLAATGSMNDLGYRVTIDAMIRDIFDRSLGLSATQGTVDYVREQVTSGGVKLENLEEWIRQKYGPTPVVPPKPKPTPKPKPSPAPPAPTPIPDPFDVWDDWIHSGHDGGYSTPPSWWEDVFGAGHQGAATGGMRQGWTMVGEEGPELVNFSDPARVYTARDTAAMLNPPMPRQQSNADLIHEIRQLRATAKEQAGLIAKLLTHQAAANTESIGAQKRTARATEKLTRNLDRMEAMPT